jgi:hypothetical protein
VLSEELNKSAATAARKAELEAEKLRKENVCSFFVFSFRICNEGPL